MKKGCSCGFWNEAQQECLYGGRGYCIQDEWEARAKEWEQLAQKFEKLRKKSPAVLDAGRNKKA